MDSSTQHSPPALPPHPPGPGPAAPSPAGASFGPEIAPNGLADWLNRWTQARRPGYPAFWVAPALAALVLSIGFLLGLGLSARAGSGGLLGILAFLLLSLGIASSVLLFDRIPALGLALLAVLALFSIWLGAAPLIACWLALVILIFGAAAYGRPATMVLTGLVLTAAPVAVTGLTALSTYGWVAIYDRLRAGSALDLLVLAVQHFRAMGAGVILAGGPLVLAWACGLAMRSVVRSRQERARAEVAREKATQEAAYAQEVADLRAGQAQLARDVHDVVGHSLAVILAQAQSAQYLGDDEVAKMRETLGHVADSARRSLGDVRGVLAGTRDPRTATPTDGLGSLISGVRAAGNEVVDRIDGVPRPLPPEIDQVAYRVLQEMLTNALKHGRAGGPVWVRQIWPPDSPHALVLEVHNLIDDQPAGAADGGGIGLESMRHRLDSVGGRLTLDSIRTSEGVMYAATAALPLRAAEVEGV